MRRIAYVMGSNGPGWAQSLKCAKRDQRLISKCLEEECEFLVYQPPDDADSHDVDKQLLQVLGQCESTDEFILYFSGHGDISLQGDLFLLWDNTSEKIYDSALDWKNIQQKVKHCDSSTKLIILDCCHAGAAVGFKGDINLREWMPTERGGSNLVLCASDRLQRARELEDEYGCSFIAHAMSNFLSDKEQSTVTVDGLLDYLQISAREHNKRFPKKKVPSPYLFGERKSMFFIKDKKPDPAFEKKAAITLGPTNISQCPNALIAIAPYSKTRFRKIGNEPANINEERYFTVCPFSDEDESATEMAARLDFQIYEIERDHKINLEQTVIVAYSRMAPVARRWLLDRVKGGNKQPCQFISLAGINHGSLNFATRTTIAGRSFALLSSKEKRQQFSQDLIHGSRFLLSLNSEWQEAIASNLLRPRLFSLVGDQGEDAVLVRAIYDSCKPKHGSDDFVQICASNLNYQMFKFSDGKVEPVRRTEPAEASAFRILAGFVHGISFSADRKSILVADIVDALKTDTEPVYKQLVASWKRQTDSWNLENTQNCYCLLILSVNLDGKGPNAKFKGFESIVTDAKGNYRHPDDEAQVFKHSKTVSSLYINFNAFLTQGPFNLCIELCGNKAAFQRIDLPLTADMLRPNETTYVEVEVQGEGW